MSISPGGFLHLNVSGRRYSIRADLIRQRFDEDSLFNLLLSTDQSDHPDHPAINRVTPGSSRITLDSGLSNSDLSTDHVSHTNVHDSAMTDGHRVSPDQPPDHSDHHQLPLITANHFILPDGCTRSLDADEYFIDRTPDLFELVLYYAYTGHLHSARSVCPKMVMDELRYWRLSQKNLDECCLKLDPSDPIDRNKASRPHVQIHREVVNETITTNRLDDHLDEEKGIEKDIPIGLPRFDSSSFDRGGKGVRARIWRLFEDPSSSLVAKILNIICVFFVVLSITNLVVSTVPGLHHCTGHEFLGIDEADSGGSGDSSVGNDTFGSTAMDDGAAITSPLDPSSSPWPLSSPASSSTAPLSTTYADPGSSASTPSDTITANSSSPNSSSLNPGSPISSSLNSSSSSTPPIRRRTIKDKFSKSCEGGFVFDIIETVCIAWFTFEFLVRFICAPSKVQFLKSVLNLIDLFATAPYYVELLIWVSGIEDNSATLLQILRVMRIGRVLRIFRLARYFDSLQVMGETLWNSRSELGLLIMFLGVSTIIFSTVLFYIERDVPGTKYTSIPASFWWCVVTLTTTGYGDITPETVLGKVAAGCACITGVLILAFPVSILVDKFRNSYENKRQVRLSSKIDTFIDYPQGS